MSKPSVCEEENYQHLHKENAEEIRNYLYYKCGSLDQAKDITQEAFIKLWEKCKSVGFDTAKGFLYTVARNLFFNQVKHNKVVLEFEKRESNKADKQDPEYVLREKEFDHELKEAISSLTQEQREVFLMNRIDELKYYEIAERLEISVKAVEKRMSKALKNLKDALEELNNHKI